MPGAAGYILVLNESRTEVFDLQRTVAPFFAEAVPEFSHSHTAALVCFISATPRFITHIARGRKGMRAGTSQRRLNLSDIREIKHPVAVERIVAKVGSGIRRHVSNRLSAGGLLPPKSLGDFVAAMMELAPDIRDELMRYSEERKEQIRRLTEGTRAALGAQKEAVIGALNIADIDRGSLLDWTPPQNAQPRSFLEGLPQARLREEQMIWHDVLTPLPGFQQVARSIKSVARFSNELVELEVIMADHTPLERQTGADLIYFNATFSSFVLVQYKAMEKTGDSPGSHFRLPNAQLAEEINRMQRVLESIKDAGDPSHRHHFRLNADPFFLKLCPRVVFDPDSVRLTPGMYMPLGYWRFVEKDSDLVGKHGGRVVTYENIGRHLDNSSFAAMVGAAWIGTTPQQTALLAPVIEELLKNGRAVAIAVKEDKAVLRRNAADTELKGEEPL